MSFTDNLTPLPGTDHAPGDEPATGREVAEGLFGYLVGLALATLITVVAFFISGTSLVWGPSIPIALVVLAVGQIGVHIVFFLHITTGPDNVNNILALAFGVLIVMLLIIGSIWIMNNMNRMMPASRMAPMDQSMPMPMQK
jgi:cytochrome o ubiquinol oxidase subunit IV